MRGEFDIVDVSTGQVSVTGDVVYPMSDVVLYVHKRLKKVNAVDRAQIQYNEDGDICAIVVEIKLPNGTTPAGIVITYSAVRMIDFSNLTVLRKTFELLATWKYLIFCREDKDLLEECCKFVETWITCLEKKKS